MGAFITAVEWTAGHLLAVAAGLRSFRDGPGDDHARFHLEVARIAMGTHRCPGGSSCLAETILSALERRSHRREKPPLARGNA